MRPYLPLLLPLLLCAAPAAAQRDTVSRTVAIERVDIAGRRPLKQTGVQKTEIDSLVLRETISSSLADVLSSGSTIFIKSYGRATLSTASFRGTAPSHTQVTWNGMKVNSPMLGQVDFSLIPAYLVDDATLYHGASSVSVTGGGLGGAVALDNRPLDERGFALRFVQGVGSFTTFDEFLRASYGGRRWSGSTRVLYSTSRNDFRYHNYHSKTLVTDDDGRIVDSYVPLERNRNGGFGDLHLMQELYRTGERGGRLSLAVWYLDSNRGLPMTSADRNSEKRKKEEQDERTLRAVAGWERLAGGFKLSAKGGYTYTSLRYRRLHDPEGKGEMRAMTDARSRLHSVFAEAEAEYAAGDRWLFTGSVTAYQHLVRTGDIDLDPTSGLRADTLYDESRFELSLFAAARWRPLPRLGIAANLRWELYGDRASEPIPALFVDYLLSRRGNVVVKASATRNFRFPTLNDLYFRPGGNRDLRPEQGWTADAGAEFSTKGARWEASGSATLFDSHVDDWILWIGSAKSGIYTPLNIKKVHSYGAELKLSGAWRPDGAWRVAFDVNAAWTRSINRGERFTPADESVGRQLPYIPVWSAAFTGRLGWRTWTLSYKWSWYSRRFTMSDNAKGTLGVVRPYFMSDLSLEKSLECRRASLSLKGCIHNLFNEEYESVLSRPMPRLNVSFFLGITPRFGRR